MVEFTPHRGGAREADWARLLSECWGFNLSRGFESPPPPCYHTEAGNELIIVPTGLRPGEALRFLKRELDRKAESHIGNLIQERLESVD
jgi:hypothetical protein